MVWINQNCLGFVQGPDLQASTSNFAAHLHDTLTTLFSKRTHYRTVIRVGHRRDTITVSSANLIICQPSWWLWRSFVYKANKGKERTQPWRYSVEEKITSDKTSFTLKHCDPSVKKSTSQLIRPVSMLWVFFDLSINTRGWIQLKAAKKTIKHSWMFKSFPHVSRTYLSH